MKYGSWLVKTGNFDTLRFDCEVCSKPLKEWFQTIEIMSFTLITHVIHFFKPHDLLLSYFIITRFKHSIQNNYTNQPT